MNDERIPSPDVLRQAILDLNEPVVFQGIIKTANDDENEWRLLELSNFIELFGDTALPFRIARNARTPEPQWDLLCPVETMSIRELLEKIEDNSSDKSYYFDYKYMHEWFQTKPEILSAVNWRCFGFDRSGKDSTLWIGSKGSHTNCHQDTYGCNLIAQLHGRKQWLLFPPDAGNMLKQTRVPYEESTIYSKFNFFCPPKADEEAIMGIQQTAKLVTLEPGQVLFVPRGWWHYVESLDLTFSINVWLQLDSDYKARLKEALVQLIITKLGHTLPGVESSLTVLPSTHMVEECIKGYHEIHENTDDRPAAKKMRKTPWNCQDLITEYPGIIRKLQDFTNEDLRQLLVSKRERFLEINHQQGDNLLSDNTVTSEDIIERIVNIVCRSDVIDEVANDLLTNSVVVER